MSESSQDPWNGIPSIGLFASANAQTFEPFPEDESAKKNKKNAEVLPEGMSRRQAKMAARAAERAALEPDPRPYGGMAAEADLVALQEFVPSAVAKLDVTGIDRDVYVATVLPGGREAVGWSGIAALCLLGNWGFGALRRQLERDPHAAA